MAETHELMRKKLEVRKASTKSTIASAKKLAMRYSWGEGGEGGARKARLAAFAEQHSIQNQEHQGAQHRKRQRAEG